MAEQVTEMVIKVDLQCCRCYKKIRKILSDIPQVKDPTFDEKKNTVKIKVVGCDPKKVRQKICCKGKDFILGIDVLPLERPKEKEKGNEKEKEKEKEKGKEKGKENEKEKEQEKEKEKEKKKEKEKENSTKVHSTEEPSKKPPLVIGYPPVYMIGKLYVCPSCHNQGCGWFCLCNCHCRRPPMCADGCGRPAHECKCNRPPMCHGGCGRPVHECRCKRPLMCHDGCGWPAHECRCRRPIYPRCCDHCSYGNVSSSWTLHGCGYGRPVCTNAGDECETPCSLM
ncbi:hypothetical protein ACJRO7_022107 [Eucalyptus globulus]|uniref:HMA domain-containing protein n=1 Tax=Eucalyptus globulus TaxID=34317 RepID=A0ABD3KNI3_EUCGL